MGDGGINLLGVGDVCLVAVVVDLVVVVFAPDGVNKSVGQDHNLEVLPCGIPVDCDRMLLSSLLWFVVVMGR